MKVIYNDQNTICQRTVIFFNEQKKMSQGFLSRSSLMTTLPQLSELLYQRKLINHQRVIKKIYCSYSKFSGA